MDYAIIIIFAIVCFSFVAQFYNAYFKRGSNISGEHLMQNFLNLKMKKSNARYYPNIKINKEF